jgi:hypothetical protein
VETDRPEEPHRHPVGEGHRLHFLVVPGVYQHRGKEFVIGLVPVVFRPPDPVIEIVVVTGGMKQKFRDWNPAPFRSSAIAENGLLRLGQISISNHITP